MSLFDLGALTDEDRRIMARAEDLIRQCRGRGARFSGFLDTRQQTLAAAAAERAGVFYAFDGGYDGAERRMLGVSEDFTPERFPFVSLTVTGSEPFGHRDLLGALMHLGIARETLGDLVVDGTSAVLFAQPAAARVIREELLRVGRASVSVEEGGEPSGSGDGVEMTGTVASVRLDAVLSLALRISRERAQELIRGGCVERNHSPCSSVSQSLCEGDLLSVRGSGRIRLQSLGGESRKGRTYVHLTVYGSISKR